jgi:beta-barrel assembly-enhancing protease
MQTRLCIVLLATLAMSAQERQTGQGVNFYGPAKEAAIGAQLAQQERQRTTPISNAAVRGYVERIGQKLAAELPNAGVTYTFEVIADAVGGPTHEPLSLPGGYIFVPASLILTARNEAEFAGMLAHAMAHCAERHGTRQATRGEVANLSTIPWIFVGGDQQLVPIGFRSFQRRFETEADLLAVKMAASAAYDPEGLVRYIGRMQPEDAARPNSAMPARDSRIAGMEKAIQQLPPKIYTSTDEFPSIQDEVRQAMPSTPLQPPSLVRVNR